ncbi:RNA polymerase sigma-70 factor [Variovorax sp. OV329]|uniref:RNA polymerase sigma-70 factor n=1 Tax=Variovorax sp. OV329 TaxID=1882825 RepID=UPI0008E9DEEE|nr:RNA polymerase sigma-70 factor [Variovorax sp. OV329]SFM32090.1 RNA polymerase sigma-70 factor, ECF subfamily [Variovorax sp. OV329]
MDAATQTFDRLRPRLMGIAYRMLGSVAEAEEVVQDAWLRWHESATDALQSAEAWLVSVVTRLSIDRLRAAKVRREHYVGTWLPEPLVSDSPDSPEQLLERADNLSVAFLALMERLTPEARAAFLLREVFDAEYDEVARVLVKSEAACRQLVHRAKEQLRDERPRFPVDRATHERLLQSFAQAAMKGDLKEIKALLSEQVELVGDGGGKVPNFGKVLRGRDRLAHLYYAVARRAEGSLQMVLAEVNGVPGLLRYVDGVLESVQSFETDGQRILRIHSQRNPDKLLHVRPL